MTKYHELFEILKDEIPDENGRFSLSIPENADVLRRAQECVARIEQQEKLKFKQEEAEMLAKQLEVKNLNKEKIEKEIARYAIAHYQKHRHVYKKTTELYAFNVFGDVKFYKSIDECAQALGLKTKNLYIYVIHHRWFKRKWQIRYKNDPAGVDSIANVRMLKFEKNGETKFMFAKEFAAEMGIDMASIAYALKRKSKLTNGWDVSRMKLNVAKLVENGVVL